MATRSLTNYQTDTPSFFHDFFKPWNEWFEKGYGRNLMMTMPAVNISENKDDYRISLAVPGMNKDDFKVEVEGNMLSISSEKENANEEKEEKFTRKEYSYSSFSRSFTLPENAEREKIDASYSNGILEIKISKKADVKNAKTTKQISIK